MSEMTSVERVKRCFERKDHDRIPRFESFWDDTIRRWQGEGFSGGMDEALAALGADLWGVGWFWPQSFLGGWETLSEDAETRTVREGNGRIARYWKNRQGTPEHIGFECDSREKWESTYKPALLKNWDKQFNLDDLKARYAAGRKQNKWCYLPSVEGFEETRSMMGDEITLMAMVEDPEWIIDVSRTFADVVIRTLDTVIDSGIDVDGIWIYGDMAFKTATMCSPTMYRELIWPDHKRLVDWAHRRGKKLIYHTDGDVNGVMDLYLQAGFDALHPLEAKANMDIRVLCPKYGDRLTFFGNCDVMKYATNDLALIEDEVRSKIEAGKKTGSYIYHSDHSVPPQVSWQTYRAIIAMVEKYGGY